MNTQQFTYVTNSGDKYHRNECYICKKTPAILIMADCCGDAIGPYCKEHMKEYFDDILEEFDSDLSTGYYPVEIDKGVQLYKRLNPAVG